MPSRAFAPCAVTSTEVPPRVASTAASASLAHLPVSRVRVRPASSVSIFMCFESSRCERPLEALGFGRGSELLDRRGLLELAPKDDLAAFVFEVLQHFAGAGLRGFRLGWCQRAFTYSFHVPLHECPPKEGRDVALRSAPRRSRTRDALDNSIRSRARGMRSRGRTSIEAATSAAGRARRCVSDSKASGIAAGTGPGRSPPGPVSRREPGGRTVLGLPPRRESTQPRRPS